MLICRFCLGMSKGGLAENPAKDCRMQAGERPADLTPGVPRAGYVQTAFPASDHEGKCLDHSFQSLSLIFPRRTRWATAGE